MNLKAVLEGLLFLVGDEGIDMKDICDILETDEENVKCLINELQKEYTSPDKGIIIKKFGDNYKLTTKKEHKTFNCNRTGHCCFGCNANLCGCLL